MNAQIELVVGRIGKPHGLRGEVTVEVRTDDPDTRFAVGRTLHVAAPKGAKPVAAALTVRSARWHQGVLLLGFEEVPDRNGAEAARGTLLSVRVAADEDSGEEDAFYEHQLVGLEVRNLEGGVIGKVTGLQPGAAQDLLLVKAADGRPTMVPFVSVLVPEVSVSGGYVVVADRPGLVSPFPEDSDVDPDSDGRSGTADAEA